MSAIREQPVQRYSEVLGFGAKGQGFVVKVEDCRNSFVVLSFSFQVWRYSSVVAMSLLSTPSIAFQSPSACMIARSSAYACFLETVVGRSEC